MDMMSYLMGQNSAIKKGMKVEVVTELPSTGEANVLYLVPKEDTGENDIFEEYLYVDNDWELIGSTDIDLSGYQPLLTAGDGISIDQNNKISSTMPTYVITNNSNNNPFILENCKKGIYYFGKNDIAYLKGTPNSIVKPIGIYNGCMVITADDTSIDPSSDQWKHMGYFYGCGYDGNGGSGAGTSDTAIYAIRLEVWEPNGGISISNSRSRLNIMAPNAPANINTTHTYTVLPQSSVVPTSDNQLVNKKYVDDAVASAGGQTIQYETMPTASADYAGKIVQYTGTTDSNYTNGYFYVCVGTTENDITTYSWSNVEVQDISNYLKFEKKDAPTTSDSIMLCKLPAGFYEINGYCRVNQDFSSTFRNALVSVYILYTNAYIWIWNKNTSKVEYYSCYTYGYGSTNDVTLVLDIKDLATKNYTTSNMFNLSGLSEYKTTTTYQINDYVYRLDSNTYKIYKCNTADTKGTWNASKWDEKTYMEYLSDKLVGGALNGSY